MTAIEKTRQLENVSFAVSNTFHRPTSAGFFNRYMLKSSGTLTATGGAAEQDGNARIINEVEIALGQRPAVRVRGVTAKLLSLLTGGTQQSTDPGSGGGTFAQYLSLPLNFWVPGGGIDASGQNANMRVRTGAVSDAHTTATAATGTIRQAVELPGVVSTGGYFLPDWQNTFIPIETASADIQYRFEWSGRDVFIYGFLIEAEDATGPTLVDGLLRELRLDFRGEEIRRFTAGQLKDKTAAEFRLANADIRAGVYFLPIRDPNKRAAGNGFKVPSGSDFTFHINTSATVEEDFSAVTPGLGDQLVVTPIVHEFIPSAISNARAAEIAKSNSRRTGKRSRSILNRAG